MYPIAYLIEKLMKEFVITGAKTVITKHSVNAKGAIFCPFDHIGCRDRAVNMRHKNSDGICAHARALPKEKGEPNG